MGATVAECARAQSHSSVHSQLYRNAPQCPLAHTCSGSGLNGDQKLRPDCISQS